MGWILFFGLPLLCAVPGVIGLFARCVSAAIGLIGVVIFGLALWFIGLTWTGTNCYVFGNPISCRYNAWLFLDQRSDEQWTADYYKAYGVKVNPAVFKQKNAFANDR